MLRDTIRGNRWIQLITLNLLAASAWATGGEIIVDVGDIDGSQGFTVSNDSGGALPAFRVGGAIGDVNGDGIEDFAWNGNDGGTGQPIYVFFGRAGGFPAVVNVSDIDGSNGFVLSDDSARLHPAVSVERAGDLNGDGIDDIAVGAQRRGDPIDAVGFVVYGRPGSFPASIDYLDLDGGNGFLIEDYSVWPTDNDDDVHLEAAGDVNGDGRDDLFVGLPDADSEPGDPGLLPGAAFVIYGRDGNFPATFDLDTIDGSNGFLIPPPPEDHEAFRQDFARSGGKVGDVNGDGRDDFAVGIPFGAGSGSEPIGFGVGRVAVVYGRATDFPASLDLDAMLPSEGFTVLAASPPDVVGDLGWSLTGLGDFDGDGFDDVLAGAPSSARPGTAAFTSGVAFVIYGAASTAGDIIAGTDGSTRVTVLLPLEVEVPPDPSPEPDAVGLGLDVAAADVDGDGRPDAVIGNAGSETADGRVAAGVNFVVFGKEGARPLAIDLLDLNVSEGYRIIGEAANDFSGMTVAAADVAGADGKAEVLVAGDGFHDDPEGSLIGAVHVLLGASLSDIFADGFESGDLTAWSAAVP